MRSVRDGVGKVSAWLLVFSAGCLLALTLWLAANPPDLNARDAFDVLPDVRLILYVPIYLFVLAVLAYTLAATAANLAFAEGARWRFLVVPAAGWVLFVAAVAAWPVSELERPWPWRVAAHGFLHRPSAAPPRAAQPTPRTEPVVLRERAKPFVADRAQELTERAQGVVVEGAAPETVYWALRMTAFELAIDPEPGAGEPLQSAVWRSRPGLVAVVASDITHVRRREPLIVGWICRDAATATRIRGDLVRTVADGGGRVVLDEQFRNVLVVVGAWGPLSTPNPRFLAVYRRAIANQLRA